MLRMSPGIAARLGMALGMALAAGGCARTVPSAQAAPGAHADEAPLASLTVTQLSGMLDQHETVAIYDNNSQETYTNGHIPGARWVQHDQVTASVLPTDRNARLVFYCHNEH